jgi:hypothetical protein
MRFFGTLFLILGIALVLLTALFAYQFFVGDKLSSGIQELGLLAAGGAASLTVGAFARRRR